MRRAFGRLLPIMLIALAVQLLAPIGVCFAASAMLSDPLHAAARCSGSGASEPDGSNTLHHSRDGSCAVCSAASSTPPPLPTPALTRIERQVYRVAWRAFLPGTFAARAVSSAQPRGPPTLS